MEVTKTLIGWFENEKSGGYESNLIYLVNDRFYFRNQNGKITQITSSDAISAINVQIGISNQQF